ncbi:ParA family protein [Ferrovibrio sp.]|uniref:ParA family protein n=1 Tax=Ferrovibrio sp. TaxID=1917215 RepID=UPI00311FA3E0
MTAVVVAVANQKGGVGKTTVSVNLAVEFWRRNFRTLVIDGDPQGSAVEYAANAPEDKPFPIPVINLAHAGAKLAQEVMRHADNYDLIVIDCPPHKTSPQTLAAIAASDLVIMPLYPSWLDLTATKATLETFEQAKALNPDIRAAVLLNGVRNKTIMSMAIDLAITELNIPRLKTEISLAEELRQVVGDGEAVALRGASKTRQQISALADELLENLNLPIANTEAA